MVVAFDPLAGDPLLLQLLRTADLEQGSGVNRQVLDSIPQISAEARPGMKIMPSHNRATSTQNVLQD